MLGIYRICNSTVGFSKYEFNNKLLSGVTLLRVTPGVARCWTFYPSMKKFQAKK